jgi:hypothetical protein
MQLPIKPAAPVTIMTALRSIYRKNKVEADVKIEVKSRIPGSLVTGP